MKVNIEFVASEWFIYFYSSRRTIRFEWKWGDRVLEKSQGCWECGIKPKVYSKLRVATRKLLACSSNTVRRKLCCLKIPWISPRKIWNCPNSSNKIFRIQLIIIYIFLFWRCRFLLIFFLIYEFCQHCFLYFSLLIFFFFNLERSEQRLFSLLTPATLGPGEGMG